ncbi:MAG: KTSC domain-containing protein [Terriglobia bacterium]
MYRDLLRANSKGSFFNRHIRGRFPYAKTDREN